MPSPYEIGACEAGRLRLESGIGNEPIVDLWAFIRDHGVDLAFHGFGENGPDGVYRYDGSHALIVVNVDRQPIARQRFTAAHELGHHVIHRTIGQPMRAVDADITAPTGASSQESEAHAFAAYLLAPDAAMKSAFPGVSGKDITVENVVDLAHRFGIAVKPTIYRLHNAERIQAADRDRLIESCAGQVQRLRVQKGYDLEELRAAPLPQAFVTAVASLYENHVVDIERAAQLLRTDVEQASTFLSAPLDDEEFDGDEFLAQLDASIQEPHDS